MSGKTALAAAQDLHLQLLRWTNMLPGCWDRMQFANLEAVAGMIANLSNALPRKTDF